MYKHKVIANICFTETANEAYNQNLFNSFTSFLNIYCSHISEINSYVVSRNIIQNMQYTPVVSNSWPSIFRSKVWVSAHSRLYAADRRLGSELPRLSRATLSSVPGTSFGRILVWTVTDSGCDSSHLVRMWMMSWTMLSQSLWMKERGPLSLDIVSVNWLSSTRQT